MTTILGIAGSLRKKSLNRALLHAAESRVPAGTTLEIATFEGFPIYDGDLEAASGVPAVVERVKARLAAADGLLLVTPEYNNSLPGPLKNAIDWLSRPPKDQPRVFGKLPVGVIGATPGRGGTRLAQAAWLGVFRTLGMRPWFDKALYVGDAASAFDSELELQDAKIASLLEDYLRGFAAYCREASPRRSV
jgi:NAD(P)H-dependent FMN reductase